MKSQKQQLQQEVLEAQQILQAGGTLLYPTHTVWGLGCDATQPKAVDKVIKIKQRPPDKSFILLLAHQRQMERYVSKIPKQAYELLDTTDGPLTIIYPNARKLPDNVTADDGSIAIRLTDHPFCKRLLEQFDKPIVSTSANVSGHPTPATFDDIETQVVQQVDYAVKLYREATAQKGQPSRIVKVTEAGKTQNIRG
jgi:L-threonylcarbamoyladenylate synthase